MKRLVLAMWLALAAPVAAAPAFEQSCVITPTQLSVAGMDPRVPFSFTFEPRPIGTTIYPEPDGTWTQDRSSVAPLTVYIWVRGHGPSLIKGSKQIGDYHVVAICSL